MSRILLTWELGRGLGHLNRLRPLATELLGRGHQVYFAARDLAGVRNVFGDREVILLPAPGKNRRKTPVEEVVTYADILLNVGFDEPSSLEASVEAWRNLFTLVGPDLIVCDHSPLALLAAQTAHVRCVTVGSGFFCPIDEAPLRALRDVDAEIRAGALIREKRLLDVINSVTAIHSLPAFDRVTQIYSGARRHFLMTFPELDHFQGRAGANYLGAWPFDLGGEPFRGPVDGPVVFAYLKPFSTLVEFVSQLIAAGINLVLYVDGWRPAQPVNSPRLQIADKPIDIRQAAEGCDLAITNATHGTAVAMLLAGKPLVQIPLVLEQVLFAEAAARTGASATGNSVSAEDLTNTVKRVINSPSFGRAAAAFADRHRGDKLSDLYLRMVDDMESLIANAS